MARLARPDNGGTNGHVQAAYRSGPSIESDDDSASQAAALEIPRPPNGYEDFVSLPERGPCERASS
eukprot:8170168-Lingulodinium_polyedra.AAC.1